MRIMHSTRSAKPLNPGIVFVVMMTKGQMVSPGQMIETTTNIRRMVISIMSVWGLISFT